MVWEDRKRERMKGGKEEGRKEEERNIHKRIGDE